MKPIELKIQGLNSFEEMQIINFDKLTRNGLFGIVGPTGSGKTSIIDGITMALYGEMSRYDGDRKKLNQCVNVNSNILNVSFSFKLTNNGESTYYTVERNYKKKDDVLKPVKVRLLKIKDEDIEVLSDSVTKTNEGIVGLTGLSYDDFTRSVILPQGKFSQFLLLANKERRDMLERIFNFEKYGDKLVKKINKQISEHKNEINKINSNLAIYGDVTEESVKLDILQCEMILDKLNNLKKTQEEQEYEKVTLEDTCKDYEELLIYEEKKNVILKDSEKINDKKSELNVIKKVEGIKPVYEENKKAKGNLKDLQDNLNNVLIEYEKLESELRETKDLYESAVNIKLSEYPELLKKESSGKQALLYEDKAKEIIKEIATYKTEIQKFNNELIKAKVEYEKEKELYLNEEEKLQAIVNEKLINFVSPEERENILTAFEVNKRIVDGKLKIEELETKYNQREENLKVNLNKYDATNTEYTLINSNSEKLKLSLEALRNNCPCDRNTLMELNNELLNMSHNLKEGEKKTSTLEKLKVQLISGKREEEEKNKDLEIIISLYNEVKIAFENIENQIKLNEKEHIIYILSMDLKEGEPCPLCGSGHHPNPHIGDESVINKNLVNERDKLENELNYIKANMDKISAQVEVQRKVNENIEVQIQEECEEILKIFKGSSINEVKDEYCKLENNYNKMVVNLETWEKNLKEEEEKQKKEDKNLNEVSMKLLTLKQEISKDEEYLFEIKSNILELSDELNRQEKELKRLKEVIKTEKLIELYHNIKLMDRKYKELDSEEGKLKTLLKELNEVIEKKEKEILLVERNLEKLEVVNNEKEIQLRELNEQISELVPEDNIKEFLSKIEKGIKKILEDEEKLKSKNENLKSKIQSISEKKAGLVKEEDILRNMCIVSEEKLKSILEEMNFTNLNDAISKFDSISHKHILESEINNYEANLNEINIHIVSLSKKLNGKDTLDLNERINKIKCNLNIIKEEINKNTEHYGVIKETLEKRKVDLIKVNKLKNERDKFIKKLDLLEDLSGIFAGNKFAESLSKGQLRYITMEATRRLKNMTNGRYALELSETEFVIRDDFNGGIKRSPKTLSGGETFIVSLCLSLALSSKIQLKNTSPLEFFFLDEGFGTLDGSAVDSVIDALEKLRLEKLSVGIITHVEELKMRLNSKIVVEPAKQGISGTVIYIE